MPLLPEQVEGLQLQLQAIAGLDSILAAEKFAHIDNEMIDIMLDQSSRFAEEKLAPLRRW